MNIAAQVNASGRKLCKHLASAVFAPPVSHVYNPLDYARVPHERYVERYGNATKRVLFFGMNPGPFGMAQTGIPFGDVEMVRTWLGIEGPVGRPAQEHPRRPVGGFACSRGEVSGRRLWGTVAERFGTPEIFFRNCFVANYCPLVFMEESGRNRTPERLPAGERLPLFTACDRYVRELVLVFKPEWVIGIGGFAHRRIVEALTDDPSLQAVRTGGILHPSPANPTANKDWAGTVVHQLHGLGVCREQCPQR